MFVWGYCIFFGESLNYNDVFDIMEEGVDDIVIVIDMPIAVPFGNEKMILFQFTAPFAMRFTMKASLVWPGIPFRQFGIAGTSLKPASFH